MKPMGRHELRELIFKLLFRAEFFQGGELQEQVKLFFEDEELLDISEKDRNYITEKFFRVAEKLPGIDALLNEKTKGWQTARMGKVELTLLRLGVYEILYDEDIPAGVAINEAVDLAKEFGQEASGGFVNAVLAKFV